MVQAGNYFTIQPKQPRSLKEKPLYRLCARANLHTEKQGLKAYNSVEYCHFHLRFMNNQKQLKVGLFFEKFC